MTTAEICRVRKVQVEKEKLPWWRWALDFALGGIRSGFGLFRRNGKAELGTETTAQAAIEEDENDESEASTESNFGPEVVEVESIAETHIEQQSSPELEVTQIESKSEKSTELESGRKPENRASEVDASREKPEEAENSPEQESSPEPENTETEVESTAEIAAAADEETEPETTLVFPVELPEDNPADLTPDETVEEEIALTDPSPQPDEGVTRPAVEEPSAPVPSAPAKEPSAPVPSAPAKEPSAPVPVPPAEAASAPEPAPALPFNPPMAPDPPTLDPPAPDPPTLEKTTAEKVAAALKARGVDAEQSPFSVIVNQVYDGPLDLLLDLIRKQDIDIYDIPIAQITAQFLAYVDRLRSSDMDVAGDFIYTAALLIHIKSKMLLPRAPVGPEESTEDPRRELVDRLLEHERFKNAAQMLLDKQMLEANTWTNPGVREFREDAGAEPEIAADTTDLVRIFSDILERARNRPILNVEEDSVTVGQMIQFLTRRLTMEDKPVALRRLLSHTHSERALIAMFLGLLELVRLQAILLRQDRQFSEIFVKKNTGFEAVVNEGLASAHDDWR
jgi:segregation and condensation protein A